MGVSRFALGGTKTPTLCVRRAHRHIMNYNYFSSFFLCVIQLKIYARLLLECLCDRYSPSYIWILDLQPIPKDCTDVQDLQFWDSRRRW